uniref:HEAT repeat domain-containing protein n=1 Tax=Calcidiscus leptoporus TaxID=127549 RepID=A0A7S0J520_9EUKA
MAAPLNGDDDGAPLERLAQPADSLKAEPDRRLQAMGWAGDGTRRDDGVLDSILYAEGVPPLDGVETLDHESGLLIRRAPPDPKVSALFPPVANDEPAECAVRMRVRAAVDERPVFHEKGLSGWLGDDVRLLTALIERMHPNSAVRFAVLEVLLELGCDASRSMGAIVACLTDPQKKVREQAARVLTEMHTIDATLTAPYVSTVASLASLHRSDKVRLVAINLLGELEEHAFPWVDILRERLHMEPQLRLRYAVAHVLSSLGVSEGADWIEERERPKPRRSLTKDRIRSMHAAQRPVSLQARIRREILREQLGA